MQACEGLSRLLLALRCRVACAKTRKTTPRAKDGCSPRLKGRGTSVLQLQATNSADTLSELGNRFSPEPPHKNPASGTLFSLVRPTAEKLLSPPGFLTCRPMRSVLLGDAKFVIVGYGPQKTQKTKIPQNTQKPKNLVHTNTQSHTTRNIVSSFFYLHNFYTK